MGQEILSGILRYRYLTSGVVMMGLLLLTHPILGLDYLLIGFVHTKTYDTMEIIYKIIFFNINFSQMLLIFQDSCYQTYSLTLPNSSPSHAPQPPIPSQATFLNSFFSYRVPLGFPGVVEMGFPHVQVQPTQRHIIREIVLSLTQQPSNASASLVSGMVGFHVYLLLLCWNFASFQLAQVLDMLSQSL